MSARGPDSPNIESGPCRFSRGRRGPGTPRAVGRRGFTILEAVSALVVVIVLISLLLPMLFRARNQARLDRCRLNQASIGSAWLMHLRETQAFPDIEEEPDWRYAGVSFSRVSGAPSLDFSRPLNRHLEARWRRPGDLNIFESPLDRGIVSPSTRDGTSGQTAYRYFGTSYRANALLLDARLSQIDQVRRPLRLAEVTREHDTVVLMGPPFWFEVLYRTGRSANWYARPGGGPVLFVDGSVRDIQVEAGAFVTDTHAFYPVNSTPDGRPLRMSSQRHEAEGQSESQRFDDH